MGYIATSNVVCNVPAEQAWEKLQDFSVPHYYIPTLHKTTITTKEKNGLGASRRVEGKHGKLDETITEWKEGKGLTIRLHKGDNPPSPFKEAQFTYRIDKLDSKQCKLTATMIYEMPWGIIGKLLNALLFGRIVRGNIRDVVLGMKGYYETGKKLDMEDLKKLRQIPEEKLPQPYQ